MNGPWQEREYLLALIADRVSGVSYSIGTAAGGRPQKPRPLPRPGDKNKGRMGNRGNVDTATVKRYLDQFAPGSDTKPVAAQEEIGARNRKALARIGTTA